MKINFKNKKQITKPTKSGAGFTLIELLVVIAIIGLLASVVLVSLNGARLKARDAKRVSDLKQLSTALELYYDDNNGIYPPGCPSNDLSSLPLSKYISKTPVDPKDSSTLYGYYYCNTCYLTSPGPYGCGGALGTASDYILATRLEDPTSNKNSIAAFGGWNNGSLNYILGSTH